MGAGANRLMMNTTIGSRFAAVFYKVSPKDTVPKTKAVLSE